MKFYSVIYSSTTSTVLTSYKPKISSHSHYWPPVVPPPTTSEVVT